MTGGSKCSDGGSNGGTLAAGAGNVRPPPRTPACAAPPLRHSDTNTPTYLQCVAAEGNSLLSIRQTLKHQIVANAFLHRELCRALLTGKGNDRETIAIQGSFQAFHSSGLQTKEKISFTKTPSTDANVSGLQLLVSD